MNKNNVPIIIMMIWFFVVWVVTLLHYDYKINDVNKEVIQVQQQLDSLTTVLKEKQ